MTRRLTLAVFWIPLFLLSACLLPACHPAAKGGDDDADAPAGEAVTPVTITHPQVGNMAKTVEVTAVSSFLLKTYIRASTGGYLKTVNIQMGQYVHKGEELFVLETKEARSLGNTVNSLDSSFHFQGDIHIKSPGEGYVTQTAYKEGDYVQDGEQLAVINDAKSFVFLLNLPYELKPYLKPHYAVDLHLPDGSILPGTVSEALPTVDAASQTQPYVIRIASSKQIPENLIAKVILVEQEKGGAVSLPKEALLSDEAQSKFWIMKMTDSATAVSMPVQKGLESGGRVEILSPPLKATDSILLTGNYGLSDTAKVKVEN